jgi:SpoVK/Ycf46/Vps4 family AAA+-type ATPase
MKKLTNNVKNVRKFDIQKTKELVEKLIAINVPVLLNGPTGVGKTSIVSEIAKEKKFTFLDFRLSTEIPENIGGLPTKKDEKRFTRLLYDKLEPAFHEKTLIFFDEFNRSNKWVRNAVMTLIFERRLGDWELDKDTRIVAAINYGNRYKDAERLEDAILARFAIINIHGDYDALLNYLSRKGGKGYLVFNAIKDIYGPKFEEKTDVEVIEPVTAGRTVDYASIIIDNYWNDPDYENLLYTVLPPDDVEIVVRYSNFELIAKILRGEEVDDIPSGIISMLIPFLSEVDLSDEQFLNAVNFFGKYYNEIGGKEIMTSFLQNMVRSKKNNEVTMRNIKEVLRRFPDLRNITFLP